MATEKAPGGPVDGGSPAGGGVADAAPPFEGGREPADTGVVLDENASEADFDRAVFRSIIGDDSPVEPAGSQRTRAPEGPATGDPSQRTTASPEPEKQPPAQGGKPPAATPQTDGRERREAETIARAVFQRDGWKGDALDQLVGNMSTEQLIAQAESMRSRQAEVDRMGNQLHQLRQGNDAPAQPGAQAADEPNEPTAPTGDTESLTDLTAAQRRVVERLREIGDDVTAEAHLAEYRERNDQARRSQNGQANQPAGDAPSETEILAGLRGPLDTLAQVYPELGDDQARIELINTAGRLLKAGVMGQGGNADEQLRDVLSRAAAVQFGEIDPQRAQRRLHAEHTQQRNGQPMPGRYDSPGQAEPMNEEQAERRAFELLAQGKDASAVGRQYEQWTGR